MKREQWIKILFTMIIATLLMLIFEIIFDIPVISDSITEWVAKQNNILIYFSIFLIMYLQVSIIPIPAIVVITAAIGAKILNTDLGLSMFGQGSTWIFILVTMLAYMLGACTSYLIGKKWGQKAIKWCAGSEEDYNKWVNFLSKKGKWPYFVTVLLPVFPDDLLCLVCGSVKFNFLFFFWSNLIGRSIGLITTLFSLILIGAGGGSPLAAIAWGSALLVELVLFAILKILNKKQSKEN